MGYTGKASTTWIRNANNWCGIVKGLFFKPTSLVYVGGKEKNVFFNVLTFSSSFFVAFYAHAISSFCLMAITESCFWNQLTSEPFMGRGTGRG